MSEIISDLYFESIKYINNRLINAEYHLERLNSTAKNIFGDDAEAATINDFFKPVTTDDKVYKLKVVYADEIIYTELQPYNKPNIKSLKIVADNNINYSFKSLDRERINNLKSGLGNDEDIIIVKNGFITDSSFANLVFFDGKNFFTPSTPLLKGTNRARLLAKGTIIEKEIKVEDLKYFESVSLINAFNELGEIVIPIENITF